MQGTTNGFRLLNGEPVCKRSRSKGTGSSGERGPRGFAGPVGQRGAAGLEGPQGPGGSEGMMGPEGPQGPGGMEGQVLSYASANLPSGVSQGTTVFNTTLGLNIYYKNTSWFKVSNNNLVSGNKPKIMCVGDSITVGYTDNPNWVNHPYRHGYREGIFNRMGSNIEFVGGSTEPTSIGTPDNIPVVLGAPDPLISSSTNLELYVGVTFIDSAGGSWEIKTKTDVNNYVVEDLGTNNTYLYEISGTSIEFKHTSGLLIVQGLWDDSTKTVTYTNGLVWSYQPQSIQTLNLYQNNFFVDLEGVSYSITNVGSNGVYTITKNDDGSEYVLNISETSIDFNNGVKTGTWNATDEQMEFTDGSIWKYQLWNAIATAGQGSHRGYGGKNISDINNNITNYIYTDDPDIILLLIGINGGTTAELNTLVSNIFTAKPGVKLIVAELTPKSTYQQYIVDLNNYITGTLIPNYKTDGKNIESVDLYSMFLTDGNVDASKLSNNQNHPNNIMYDQMSVKWIEGINSVLY